MRFRPKTTEAIAMTDTENPQTLNRRMATQARNKIRTSHIIRRLESYVLDEEITSGTTEKKKISMSSAQVTAALGLLRKVLPDMKTSDITVSDTNEVGKVSDVPITGDKWQEQYGHPKPDPKQH